MQLASWLSAGPSCLPILPTLLCPGGAESTVSQVAFLRPGQLVLEDSRWRSIGCNSLVHSPLFLAMIIVGKEANTHADFTGCLQDLNGLAMLNVLEIHFIHS